MKKLCSDLLALAERMHLVKPVHVAKLRYFLKFHKRLNLEHPEDLNEKINYLAFNTDTTVWSRLADKYEVRAYVQACGLSDMLTELYGVWDDASQIDFDKLPQSFVLKTNHGCGEVLLCKDKNELDYDDVRRKLNKWLNTPYGILSAEPHYMRIKPKITAEQYLLPPSFSTSLIDYKFYCFDGEPESVLVCYDRRIGGHVYKMLYDLDWNPRTELVKPEYRDFKEIPRPESLQQMIDACRKLAKGFPALRVDFYDVDGKPYFGELTFTPNGGRSIYLTAEYMKELGKRVHI